MTWPRGSPTGPGGSVGAADLRHRLLYRRVYDRHGPAATWFGCNPFLADLEGDPAQAPVRPSLRNIAGVARTHLGGLGTLTIVNLFTRRSAAAADIAADGGDRLDHDAVVRGAVAAPATARPHGRLPRADAGPRPRRVAAADHRAPVRRTGQPP